MNVNIIEPIKNFIKEFNTIDEFNAFYSMHKDEMDALTTHKLNKMNYVKGYRITKIKGVLMLKRWDTTKNDDEEKIREEITNASTRAKEVDEYVRNDLTKKVETYKFTYEKMKNDSEKDINDLKDDIRKIKSTINDLIDYINGYKK
ncbi:hypothetical protein M9Y10_017124 [Tritrichomonas musculus]|uniref:SAM domain-containing protein n=1 Tax=Tritrichomonas musculus TaxID=1915356 RepID=A0ABR2HV79_9EUKA